MTQRSTKKLICDLKKNRSYCYDQQNKQHTMHKIKQNKNVHLMVYNNNVFEASLKMEKIRS